MSLVAVCEDEGLRLLARALRFGPRSGGEVVAWAAVLADDLLALGFLDGADDDLVRGALVAVGRRQSEWPTTVEVLEEARAARRRRSAEQARLPVPPVTEEQRRRGRLAIARVVAAISRGAHGLDDVADDISGGRR